MTYTICADELVIGKNVTIEDGVRLQGRSARNAKRIVIGDNVFIGRDTNAYVEELVVGSYTTLHNHALIAGDLPCRIGHCCWIGQNTILNCTGGLTLGNGVGIGAYSQLWTHIRHGDLLQGCRWNSTRPLIVEDDVWFVGHCIVSPVRAGARSMAMVGAVITKDMEPDHTYAGAPAKDITEKVGPQFRDPGLDHKYRLMSEALEQFYQENHTFKERTIKVVSHATDQDAGSSAATIFDVSGRRYWPRRTEEEFAFMRFLLGRLYKFFPADPV